MDIIKAVRQTSYPPPARPRLAQGSKYDPQKIAAGLPANQPVLAMCGAKDQQVSCDDVKIMMQGFQPAGNNQATLAELPDVDHVFKEVPGSPTLTSIAATRISNSRRRL